ncbi:hypothetical protein U8335_18550 [Roseiconus lacunae]|uniref:hypothetical protein n=1 Tax=Roseiconus lacunae TaxID=2605694 RepID=UPI00308CAF3F|nr:hypothetical protein U8335_18550 [Stieleria sp. HD01]
MSSWQCLIQVRWPNVRSYLAVVMLSLLNGCGSDLVTQYGANEGYYARQSINGFTTFRDSFDHAGFDSRGITRLTERTRKVTSIIWTPSKLMAVDQKTVRWMDRWLQQGGRTLVYVIPDSGSRSDYFRQLRSQAAPDQRLEYRRKLGESLIDEHRAQYFHSPVIVGGWFVATPRVQQTVVSDGKDTTSNLSWVADDGDNQPVKQEWVIESLPEASNQTASQTVTVTTSQGLSTNQTVASPPQPKKSGLQFSSLVETAKGETVLAQLTADNWHHSQVFVVASGSLLTNYGLTKPSNRHLAERLIEQCKQIAIDGEAIDEQDRLTDNGNLPQVGFVTASDGLPVSSRVDEIPRATGAESLTQFPLVLVTFHAAVIGIVFCLMLFPIFGRPAKVDRGTLTHFGDHLDAVATLMYRRGGEAFARKRISEYMRRVRGETHGPWVVNEPVDHTVSPSASSAPTGRPQSPANLPPQSQANHSDAIELDDDFVADRSEAIEQTNRPEEQR